VDTTGTNYHQDNSEPPPYDQVVPSTENNTNTNMAHNEGAKSSQGLGLKSWSKKTWIIIGAIIAIIIVVVIVVPVEVTKANAYPSYTTLNYTLAETYSTDTL
jgi:uncharacterized membrane protein YvbJ